MARQRKTYSAELKARIAPEAIKGQLTLNQIATHRGRALDNVFIERLWRSVKYEEIYLHDHRHVPEARLGLGRHFDFYNHQRLHQALDYRTPAAVFAQRIA